MPRGFLWRFCLNTEPAKVGKYQRVVTGILASGLHNWEVYDALFVLGPSKDLRLVLTVIVAPSLHCT